MDVYEVQFKSGPLAFFAQRAAEKRHEHLRPLLNKHASEDRIGVTAQFFSGVRRVRAFCLEVCRPGPVTNRRSGCRPRPVTPRSRPPSSGGARPAYSLDITLLLNKPDTSGPALV